MIKIIPQNLFKNIPWKNGKGVTLELALNDGGTLNQFDWRLSIAKVDNDGEFSDFNGYTRNLVLIDGKGVLLNHNESQIDRLDNILDFSTFDGSNKTHATLIAGPITDLNLMTRTRDFAGSVETFSGSHKITLKYSQLCFVYGLTKDLEVACEQVKIAKNVIAGDLIQINAKRQSNIVVTGQDFLIAYIDKIKV